MELFGSNFNLFRKREAPQTPGMPSSTMPPEPQKPQGADYMERIAYTRSPQQALLVAVVYQAVRLRSDVITRLSKILGVSADELLGTKTRRSPAAKPTGRSRQLFDAVSKLPRRQQEKVFSILEPFVAQHANGK